MPNQCRYKKIGRALRSYRTSLSCSGRAMRCDSTLRALHYYPSRELIPINKLIQTKAIIAYAVVAFVLGLITFPYTSFAQQLNTYTFEQVDSLQAVEKRPVLVFMHTRWCKYCGLLRHTTLKNSSIVELLNNKYYYIEFDAEEKRSVLFNKRQFVYRPTGLNTGLHQLATVLGDVNGMVSFPALCFLNTDYEIVFQYSQYLNSKELLSIITKLL